MFVQQPPIVVEVVKQPPVTREITMGDVVLGAFGLTGVIIVCALVAGAIAGSVFIWIRRARDRRAEAATPDGGGLRLNE